MNHKTKSDSACDESAETVPAAPHGAHTPGPWEWIGDSYLSGGGNDEVLRAGDDGRSYGMHSALIEHHYDTATKEANKALIAAAPELLAALDGLLAIDDSERDSGTLKYAKGSWTDKQWKAAIAVRAKATGAA